jgi:methionyl aminopeptidase
MTMINTLEATGAGFDLSRLLEMRLRTRQAVNDIAAGVEVGMREEDAKAMARDLLASREMKRGWHHIIVRCGSNTTKDFMAQSEPGVVLQPDDIFFVDIGPVFDGYEGDGGDTFVFGSDPEHHKAKADAKAIWQDVRAEWFTTGRTGRDLYDFAIEQAESRGWKLNMDLSGHRLSEYPHSAHYDGPMAEVDFRPSPSLWVLEIAIIHPTRPFGAFYEDLLLEDQAF